MQIADIKSRVSIESVLGEYGCKFKGKSTNCPSDDHEDMHPSAWLYRGRDGYKRLHCGGCGFDVDVIGAVQELYGLDFKAALKHLADRAGISYGPLTPTEARVVAKARREREVKRAAVAAFKVWEQDTADDIAAILRRYRHLRTTRTDFTEGELQVLAEITANIDILSYHYGILCGRNNEAKFELYKEMLHAA